ncbi:tripartite tricarboxylate transporter permease [Desulfovibrio sp. OttesenSCG-928-I05]|nr:tripartite tricarboxylate transporter permease [Desulfovibrio sp. OttesenSCG-928-I05]
MEHILSGLVTVFSPFGLLMVTIGVVVGMFVGAMPGLGPSIGIALLIPFTYSMDPQYALLLLVSLYMAAEYGGSISAILLSTPGTAAAAATVVDGYPMKMQGRSQEALGVSLTASSFGGMIGAIALILFAQPLAQAALLISPAGYFAIGLFGLTTVASLSGGSMLKGLLGAGLGLAVATAGIDPISGTPRFTFGYFELFEGVPVLSALIGLFALSEAFVMTEQPGGLGSVKTKFGVLFIGFAQIKRLFSTMVMGSFVGTVLGILPGVGGNIACWVAYARAKKQSGHPETFGKGEPKGVAAPEAANNATVGGAIIPMLSLGVPGSPTTAVLMGALVLHGLRPGPQLFMDAPIVVYSLFVGLAVSVIVMYLVGIFTLPLWARVMALPQSVLSVLIIVLGLVGAFTLRSLMFDVYLALGFGIVGYILKKFGFSMAPILLALVLGYLIESSFRTALVSSEGDYMTFVTDPIALVFIVLSILAVLWPIVSPYLKISRAPKGA